MKLASFLLWQAAKAVMFWFYGYGYMWHFEFVESFVGGIFLIAMIEIAKGIPPFLMLELVGSASTIEKSDSNPKLENF